MMICNVLSYKDRAQNLLLHQHGSLCSYEMTRNQSWAYLQSEDVEGDVAASAVLCTCNVNLMLMFLQRRLIFVLTRSLVGSGDHQDVGFRARVALWGWDRGINCIWCGRTRLWHVCRVVDVRPCLPVPSKASVPSWGAVYVSQLLKFCLGTTPDLCCHESWPCSRRSEVAGWSHGGPQFSPKATRCRQGGWSRHSWQHALESLGMPLLEGCCQSWGGAGCWAKGKEDGSGSDWITEYQIRGNLTDHLV